MASTRIATLIFLGTNERLSRRILGEIFCVRNRLKSSSKLLGAAAVRRRNVRCKWKEFKRLNFFGL